MFRWPELRLLFLVLSCLSINANLWAQTSSEPSMNRIEADICQKMLGALMAHPQLSPEIVDDVFSEPRFDPPLEQTPRFDRFASEAPSRGLLDSVELVRFFSVYAAAVKPLAQISHEQAGVLIERFAHQIRGASSAATPSHEPDLSREEVQRQLNRLLKVIEDHGAKGANREPSPEQIRLHVLSELTGSLPPMDSGTSAYIFEYIESAVIAAQKAGVDIGFRQIPSPSQRAQSARLAAQLMNQRIGLSAIRLYQAVQMGHPLEEGSYRNHLLGGLLSSLGFPPENLSLERPPDWLLVREGLDVSWLRITHPNGDVVFINASNVSVLENVQTDKLSPGETVDSEIDLMRILSTPSESQNTGSSPSLPTWAEEVLSAEGGLAWLERDLLKVISDLVLTIRQLESIGVSVNTPVALPSAGWENAPVESFHPITKVEAKQRTEDFRDRLAEINDELNGALNEMPTNANSDLSRRQLSEQMEIAMGLLAGLISLPD